MDVKSGFIQWKLEQQKNGEIMSTGEADPGEYAAGRP